MTKLNGTAKAAVAALLLSTAGLSGCASMNRTAKGAIIGGAGGAAVGAIIGKQVGSTAKGAIIGAAVGGAAGAIIGHRMDEQAKNLAATIPGATVQRVGEGIVVTFDSGLLFPYNSTQLLPAGQQNLQNLAQSLEQYPETEVLVVGHTDSIGSMQYNQTLSEGRAASAANLLASYGVPRDRIRTQGRGETEPIADNGTEAGRQQNRRVEVAIYASEEYRERLLQNNPTGE
ncbi:MAG TPA: OmpA family protein [Longimicrobiaceae bacterium]|nr:OmpA family protein [Longimicrobiaceae bacterium]